MYARFVDNGVVFAPRVVEDGRFAIINPSADVLAKHNYYPVKETPPPETGGNECPSPFWVEEDGFIVQKWVIKPIVAPA